MKFNKLKVLDKKLNKIDEDVKKEHVIEYSKSNDIIVETEDGEHYSIDSRGVFKKIEPSVIEDIKLKNYSSNEKVLNNILTKTQFENIRRNNSYKYTGSGVVNYSTYDSQKISKDMWRRDSHSNGTWTYDSLLLGYHLYNNSVKDDEGEFRSGVYNIDGVDIHLSSTNVNDNNIIGINKIIFDRDVNYKIVTDLNNIPPIKYGENFILNDTNPIKWNEIKAGHNAKISEVGTDSFKLTVASDDYYAGVYLSFPVNKHFTYEIIINYDSCSDDRDRWGIYDEVEREYIPVYGFQDDQSKGLHIIEFKPKETRESYRLSLTVDNADKSDDRWWKFKDIHIRIKQPTICYSQVSFDNSFSLLSNLDVIRTNTFMVREDLVLLEKWEEDISDKGVVHPYGNVQYRAGSNEKFIAFKDKFRTDGFQGYEYYSLYGDWQKPSDYLGDHLVWNELTDEEKAIFVTNPENNIYLDNDKIVQVKYRIRVIKGFGVGWSDPDDHSINLRYGDDSMKILPRGAKTVFEDYNINDKYNYYYGARGHIEYREQNIKNRDSIWVAVKCNDMIGYKGKCHAINMALVKRKNYGAYDPSFNPEGTSRFFYNDNACRFEEVGLDFTKSVVDCFNTDNIAVINPNDKSKVKKYTDLLNNNVSGYVLSGSTVVEMSGHPWDELYYDDVHDSDVYDLRYNVNPVDDLIGYMFKINNLAENGEVRGREKLTRIIERPGTGSSDKGRLYLTDDYETLRKYHGGKYPLVITEKGYSNAMVKYPFLTTINRYNNTASSISWSHLGSSRKGNLKNGTISTKLIPLIPFLDDRNTRTSIPYNNTIVVSEIIGDSRKIYDRTTVVVNDDKTVVFKKGTYVRCDKNDNNSGDKGHYYLYRGSEMTLHTNSTDGDANKNNGHIDFSDTGIWLDLGNDESKGGYPDKWYDHGIVSSPLTMDENKNFVYPLINTDNHGNYERLKLTKKYERLLFAIVYYDNGDIERYTTGNVSCTDCRTIENGSSSYGKKNTNMLYYNVHDSRFNVNTIIQVFYLAKAKNVYENRNVEKKVHNRLVSPTVRLHSWHGNNLMNNLLGLILDHNSSDPDYGEPALLGKQISSTNVFGDASWGEQNKHERRVLGKANIAGKYLSYISDHNHSKLEIGYLYKQIKFNVDHDVKTYFDTGFKERKYEIPTGDDGLIINGPLDHKSIMLGNNYDPTVKKYIELMIDDKDVVGSLAIYVASTNDEDKWTLLETNVDQFIVGVGGVYDKLIRIPITMQHMGRIKLVKKLSESLWLSRLRVIGASTITDPGTYDNFGMGDDDKFQVRQYVSLVNDLNGDPCLTGFKYLKTNRYLNK